jgi:hypothetical protein
MLNPAGRGAAIHVMVGAPPVNVMLEPLVYTEPTVAIGNGLVPPTTGAAYNWRLYVAVAVTESASVTVTT